MHGSSPLKRVDIAYASCGLRQELLRKNAQLASGENMLTLDSLLIEDILKNKSLALISDTTALTNSQVVTLTAASSSFQKFTGNATNCEIILPNATTLDEMRHFIFFNLNNFPITVKNSAGEFVFLASQTTIAFVWLDTKLDSKGHWIYFLNFINIASGIVNYRVTSAVPFAVTSIAYTAIPSFSVTPTAGTYLCQFNADANCSSPKYFYWIFAKNGVTIATSERRTLASKADQGVMLSTLDIIQFNGTENLEVYLKCEVAGNTFTVNARTMILTRLGD